jgi:hypothetical protein
MSNTSGIKHMSKAQQQVIIAIRKAELAAYRNGK